VTSTAPHQALYRRWRAQTFSEIVGQGAVVETLRNAVRQGRVAHAILFVGPRGTGKTSLARILAKGINCTDLQDGDPCDRCPSCTAIREGRALDLVEIDAASNRGIDAIRELRERIQYAPTDLRRKVYILDEAHQITKDAWNALLKSLEEPPDFVVFMFASTHPQEFPPAILSRLQRFDVRRLTVPEIEGKLNRILEADGRAAEPAAVRLIARLAAGGMRDAESILDQLLSSAADRLDEAAVRELLGLADAEAVDAFVDALVAADPAAGIAVLDSLEERGRDVRVLLEQVVEAVRGRLVDGLSGGPDASAAVAGLATAARRLGAIDPTRAGVGGLRLQLELTLFAEPGSGAVSGTVRASAPDTVAPPQPTPPAVAPATRSRAPKSDAPAPKSDAPAPKSDAPAPKSGVPAPKSDAPPPTPDAPPAPGGELDLLRARWPEVVARISQHPPTKPLIAACRPISVEGNVVTLGFPEDQAFLRDVADRRRPILEQGMAEFLGRSVAVRVVATNLDLVPAPAAGDDAAALIAEARRIFADELVDVGEVT
jgi:DNA polymerase-3 subunit gamma/tau